MMKISNGIVVYTGSILEGKYPVIGKVNFPEDADKTLVYNLFECMIS